MKFKEFTKWCNERACDGCWSLNTSMFCIDILNQVRSVPFWKREKKWQLLNELYSIENDVVAVINNKIKEVYGE